MKDAPAFSWGDSRHHGAQNKRQVLVCDVDLLYIPDEKDRADSSLSDNTMTVQMIEERGIK